MTSKIPQDAIISIIAPVYQGMPHLLEFYSRMTVTLIGITPFYELIFVNDGSTDATADILRELHQKDSSVVVITLSRNFGQLAAIRTGLSYSKGRYIYTTDSDLEESPEWLEIFYNKILETNADIVFGAQDRATPKTFVMKWGGELMRFILQHFSDIPVIKHFVTATLMNRSYVDALLKFTERTGGFYIFCQLAGFSHSYVTVEKQYKGTSSYTLCKKATLFIDHIVSATNFPIICIVWTGIIVSMIGLCMVMALALHFVNTSLFFIILSSVWLIGGMALVAIGVVGLYISRALIEVKRRPIAIVKNILDARLRLDG